MALVKYIGGCLVVVLGIIFLVNIINIGPVALYTSIAEYAPLQRLLIYGITVVLLVGGVYFAIRGLEESV